METLNNNYRVFDKASGAALSTLSIDTFWAPAGAAGPFDPKVLYDPYNDRWIVCAVSGAGTSSSSVLIGVSLTGNPEGSYFLFRVTADPGGVNWADFPTIGFNKNWVAINVNMFSISTGSSVGSKCLVADYAQLRSGALVDMFFSGTGFCSSPAVTTSSRRRRGGPNGPRSTASSTGGATGRRPGSRRAGTTRQSGGAYPPSRPPNPGGRRPERCEARPPRADPARPRGRAADGEMGRRR